MGIEYYSYKLRASLSNLTIYSTYKIYTVLEVIIHMKDKIQRVTSYTSAYGIKIYEREQYHAASKEWYIIGDCSPSKKYLEAQVNHHNTLIDWQCLPSSTILR